MEEFLSFQECWERVKEATDLKTKVALAEFLDITSGSVGGAKQRGTFPPAWAVKIAAAYNLNTDWILTGKGPKTLGVEESKGKYSIASENTETSVPKESILEALQDKYVRQLEKNQELLEQIQELKDERNFLKNRVEEVVKEVEILKKKGH